MKKREPHYYQIRVCAFWGLIGALVSLIGIAYFKTDLYEWWLCSRGREEISLAGMESRLEDKRECFLCGNSSQSLKERYEEFGTVGAISLNDWYVLEFQLRDCNGGVSTAFGNTGELIYCSKGVPSWGMASIEIKLPDDYGLNPEMIQNHLCQECLDKIIASLDYGKWKNEKKKAIPLCLVDFKTLEIYSLQDWHRGCTLRDYWVEIEHGEEQVEMKIFSLQGKE